MKNRFPFLCLVIFFIVFTCCGFAKDMSTFCIKAGSRITVVCDTVTVFTTDYYSIFYR